MNNKEKAAKRRWLKALRSGEYKQAKYQLYDPSSKGFCCLGVMQHCAMDGRVETTRPGAFRATPSDTFFVNFPEYKWVQRKIGTLASMNDWDSKSFQQIARWISRNWK